MRNWILITILIMGLLPGAVLAQWSKSISINTSYDDNAFRNYADLPDYVTQLSGYLAKDSGGDRWRLRLFYRGGLDIFARYGERNYQYHQLGTAWSGILNERGNALNIGINGSLRANGEVYNYYNYREGSGYGNIKLNAGSSSTAVLGYRLRGRWYSNLAELNYTEHYVFARYSHFFGTRTTFIIEGNYGRKIYREQITGDILEQWNEQDTMNGYGHRQGGMGRMGGNGNTEGVENGSQNSGPSGIGQWVGEIRLAQSLGNTTGLSADFIIRRNQGGELRYLAGQASGYISEDELFDDPYGYESEELEVTLTKLLPWKLTLKAGFASRWKDYLNRPALDLNGELLPGGDLRQDRQLLSWLNLAKSLTVLGGKAVNLVGECYWMDNHSNDLYYDYQVILVSLGLGITF